MREFVRTTDGFNYVFEKTLEANEVVLLKMPRISANKRGVNDIGWQTTGDAVLYGTLVRNPKVEDDELWQELVESYEVNKTISAIKIVNGKAPCRVVVRVILN